MKNSLRERGITLIALIIMIAILLILASVAINAVVTNNGLINRAQKSSEAYNQVQKDEKDSIGDLVNKVKDEKTDTVIGGEDNSSPDNPPKQNVYVTGVDIFPNNLTLIVGDKKTINAKIIPNNADNQTVTWSSNNVKVATVATNGEVTAVAVGDAIVTATCRDNGKEYSAQCKVTVKNEVAGIKITPAEEQILTKEQKVMNFTAEVTPKNTEVGNIIWHSTDEDSIFVDDTGKVIVRKDGQSQITASTTDSKGNTIISNSVNVIYDNTAPVIKSITRDPNEWTNKQVTLTVDADDNGGSGVVAYSFDGGKSWQTSNKKVYSVNTSNILVKVRDKVGYESEVQSINVDNIDTTAPVIKSITRDPNEWTNKQVTLTVDADDNGGSGVVAYSFDGGKSWQESNKKVYSANTSNISVKVKDRVGYESAAQSINVDNIDTTAPVIKSVTKDPNEWTNGQVTLTVNADDNGGSGIVSYSFDGGKSWQTSNKKVYSTNTSNISVKVKDKVGYESTAQSINVDNIDTTAPVIKSVTKDPSGWTNSQVTLTVNADDNGGSGVVSYSFDGGKSWQTSNNKVYSTNTSNISVKVKDKVGYESTVQSVNVDNIDKTAPTVSVYTTNNATTWKQDLAFSITISDTGGSGLLSSNSKTYRITSSSTSASSYYKQGTYTSGRNTTVSGLTGELYLWVQQIKDNAQNTSTASTVNNGWQLVGGPYKIDKEKPTIEVTNVENAINNVWDGSSYDISWYDQNTSVSQFKISRGDQLAGLQYLVATGKNFSGKTITLTQDIDMNSMELISIGEKKDKTYEKLISSSGTKTNVTLSGSALYEFAGVFDGGNNLIKNIKLTDNGLFYKSTNTIKNVKISGTLNLSKGKSEEVGVICSYSTGKISNCKNYADLKLAAVSNTIKAGGICGNSTGTIDLCINFSFTSNKEGLYSSIGGIVSSGNIVENCVNYGSIGDGNKNYGAAGIAYSATDINNCINYADSTGISYGMAYQATNVKNCYNYGNLGNFYNGTVVGCGIVVNAEIIENCYNTGQITGNVKSAGITIGDSSQISKCGNTGKIRKARKNLSSIWK